MGTALFDRSRPTDQRADNVRLTARAARGLRTMAQEVREGLARRPLPELPCQYFYDERGSTLFERITELPEYYQTRTETALLHALAGTIVDETQPRELVELGSGASPKVLLLLDAMQERNLLERVILLDVAEAFLRRSLGVLEARYPRASVSGIVGDFVHDLRALGPGGGRLLLLLAGTIGNLHPRRLQGFLRDAARALRPGDAFLVGLDLVKDPARLEAAYNDAAGVTAEFNRNILRVVDERLGADFDPADFEHVAFYDPAHQWIEMRLRARRAVHARVPAAGLELRLAAGGEIRTEISCKYTRESFSRRLRATGLQLVRFLPDPEELFALALLARH
jgi:L-histidine N-alpha-methyltransferase